MSVRTEKASGGLVWSVLEGRDVDAEALAGMERGGKADQKCNSIYLGIVYLF